MIRSLDTNVLIRLMTRDDEEQARRAEALVREDFALSATVLVETDWVLKSCYRWSREQRAAGLRIVLNLPNAVEIPVLAHWAVERFAAGGDFAAMMHVAASRGASAFATFNRSVARTAGASTPLPIETLA